MRKISFILIALIFSAQLRADTIFLQWIDRAPAFSVGQSFGVPFAKGVMNDNGSFSLTGSDGEDIPCQTWPLAHWSDGSVKWMGVSATIPPDMALLEFDAVAAKKKSSERVSSSSMVTINDDKRIVIDNGLYTISFPKSGNEIVESIEMGGKELAGKGKLVLRTEDRSRASEEIVTYQNFESRISSTSIERSGDIATVIKIEGTHKALKGSREWLPFTVRFYIYKDAQPIRMVHSFVFDGDQDRDFIKGLGVEFSIPLREENQNRHVAFAGESDGLLMEAVKPFTNRRRASIPGSPENLHALQFEGKRVLNYSEYPQQSKTLLDEWADFGDYRLVQNSSDGYYIQKRTAEYGSWFGNNAGRRARGFVLAGDVTGGLGVSLKDFWQSFPAELDVHGMCSDTGKITVWMWSPEAAAMDLRHYDIKGHGLSSSYEDYVEGNSTPYGIARTSEIYLFPYSEMPGRDEISAMANIGQYACQIMATPQYLHDAGAFGKWSLPASDGNATKLYLEGQINAYLKFYMDAVESQHWYGFWNYGDIMHSYDPDRHNWNYDVGGMAWDNTEIESELWLWLSFIRTGSAELYRMASSMTRHTSEVDCYHIGPMKGLGTRHNISHWGCGSKEARIGQAWWKRYAYYLTTDERLGDLMTDALAANESLVDNDPLIRALTRKDYPTAQPTRLRWAPDWTALVGNWFTEWERTGDQHWMDMIKAGMESLSHLPNGLYTGKQVFGYDPASGKLYYEGDPDWVTNNNQLANLQGSIEVMMEALDEVGHKDFTKTYEEYASWYSIPYNDPSHDLPGNERFKNYFGKWQVHRITAFASKRTGNDYISKLAWECFLQEAKDKNGNVIPRIDPYDVDGAMGLNRYKGYPVETSDIAQWNIDAIVMMELIGDSIPDLKDIQAGKYKMSR